MQLFRDKIQTLFVIFTLLSLIWAGFNISYFTHIHIDVNGHVTVHAHPFQKEDHEDHHVPAHTHSKSEFSLLAQIFNVLTVLLFFNVLLLFYLSLNPNIEARFVFQWIPIGIFFNSILKRGPPSFVQS